MTATADAMDGSTVKELLETIDDLQGTVKHQAERIDTLEEKLTTYRVGNECDKAQIKQRITNSKSTR